MCVRDDETLLPTPVQISRSAFLLPGEKPYKCLDCCKNFPRMAALNIHRRSVHNTLKVKETT
jgi:hypothetical protein